jgi:hypothetical protein
VLSEISDKRDSILLSLPGYNHTHQATPSDHQRVEAREIPFFIFSRAIPLPGVLPFFSKTYDQETGHPSEPTLRSCPALWVIKGKVFAQSMVPPHGNCLSGERNNFLFPSFHESLKAMKALPIRIGSVISGFQVSIAGG